MRLKLMLFNVQDFFLKLEYPVAPADLAKLNEDEWQLLAPRDTELKPLAKLKGIARIFEQENPDVAMLCEVGGPEAAANFSRLFLEDRYETLATPPVSDRGIETAYLVRRDLKLRRQLLSHANEPVHFLYPHETDPVGNDVTALIATTLGLDPPDKRRPSRDFPELRLFKGKSKKPVLVLLLAHLKSPFDPNGLDKGGVVRRAAEVETLLKVRSRIQAEVGAAVPIVIAGDLNGRAGREDTGPEFAKLYTTTDLEDVLEVAKVPSYDRITHITYYQDKGRAGQIDYILLPKSLHGRLDVKTSYVHRFRFEEGDGTVAFPGSLRERWQLPSDHYPVVAIFDLP